MQQGHYVFFQVMAHLPLTTFRRCVARYRGEHKIKRFSCLVTRPGDSVLDPYSGL
jgi:hypothetical protein